MKKTRARKILGAVVVVLALLLFVGNTFLLPAFIRKMLENVDSGGLVLKVDHIKTGFFNQSLTLSGVQLSDSTGFLDFRTEQLKLAGISVRQLFRNNSAQVRNVELEKPRISISKEFKLPPRDTLAQKDTSRFSVFVKHIAINDLEFLLFDNPLNNDSILGGKLDLKLNSFQINRTDGKYQWKNFGLDEAGFSLTNLCYFTADDFYRMQAEQIAYSTKDSDLLVSDFRVIPLKGMYEVGEKNGFQTDWFDAEFEKISLEKIDLGKLLNDEQLFLKAVKLENINAHTFRDVRLPMPEKPDTKLPDVMIAGIPLPLRCDSLLVSAANVRYTERDKGSSDAGNVEFANLNIRFPNFTNIDSLIGEPLKMEVEARVMNSTDLKAEMTFASAGFPHSNRVSGSATPMPFSAFNAMIEPSLNARIEEGKIHRMSFDFTYNNNVSSGHLVMDYDGLKLELLKKDEEKSKKLESFLLNSVLIRKQNLPGDRHYIKGNVSFERDKKKSVFNYWWKSILSGMKSVMT